MALGQQQWLRDARWGNLLEEQLSCPSPGLDSSGPGWQPCQLHTSSVASVKWVYQRWPHGWLVEGDGEVVPAQRLWSVLPTVPAPGQPWKG